MCRTYTAPLEIHAVEYLSKLHTLGHVCELMSFIRLSGSVQC